MSSPVYDCSWGAGRPCSQVLGEQDGRASGGLVAPDLHVESLRHLHCQGPPPKISLLPLPDGCQELLLLGFGKLACFLQD